MDRQVIFNTVIEHLITQGQRSMHKSATSTSAEIEFCAYRGSDGKKCAIGVLIPDSKYDIHMETQGVEELIGRGELNFLMGDKPDATGEDSALLVNLQNLHDDQDAWASLDYFKAEAAEVARSNRLSYDILDRVVALGQPLAPAA